MVNSYKCFTLSLVQNKAKNISYIVLRITGVRAFIAVYLDLSYIGFTWVSKVHHPISKPKILLENREYLFELQTTACKRKKHFMQ